jgi:hypothetical protein
MKARQKILRLDHHVRRSVPVRRLQRGDAVLQVKQSSASPRSETLIENIAGHLGANAACRVSSDHSLPENGTSVSFATSRLS